MRPLCAFTVCFSGKAHSAALIRSPERFLELAGSRSVFGSRCVRAKKSAELVLSFFFVFFIMVLFGSCFELQPLLVSAQQNGLSLCRVLGKNTRHHSEFSLCYRIEQRKENRLVLLLISFCLLSFITSQLSILSGLLILHARVALFIQSGRRGSSRCAQAIHLADAPCAHSVCSRTVHTFCVRSLSVSWSKLHRN